LTGLRGARVLELLRDYPELLGPLEALGVDPGAEGSEVLGAILAREKTSPDWLMAELRWRQKGHGRAGLEEWKTERGESPMA
jgi:hypothetical protein